MQTKDNALKSIKEFRLRHSIEGTEENIATTLHIMNTHLIDEHEALDHSSRSGDDHGIDGWHFDENTGEMFIYQSKLSESKPLAIKGMNDLINAKEWLETVLIDGSVDKLPSNNCLYNLYTTLASKKDKIRKISFILISLFNSNELEDKEEYESAKRNLIGSKLQKFMLQTNAEIDLRLEEYNFDKSLPVSLKKYPITKID